MEHFAEQVDAHLSFSDRDHNAFQTSGAPGANTRLREPEALAYADPHSQLHPDYMEYTTGALHPGEHEVYDLQQAFETYRDGDRIGEDMPGLQAQAFNWSEEHPGNRVLDLDDDSQSGSSEHDQGEDVLRDIVEAAADAWLHDDPFRDVPVYHVNFGIADLDDPPGLLHFDQHIAAKRNEGYFQDRWEVDKESARFLAVVMRETKQDETNEMRYHLPTSLRHMKVEEPVLQSDPAADMRNILKRNEVHIAPKDMVAFSLDENKDQSLAWGAFNMALPARLYKDLAAEKWQVDAETMAFMKAALADDGMTFEDWVRREHERTVILRTSPILLPLSPPLSPMRIPSPLANLELTSTPEDPTDQEAARLQAEIMEREEDEGGKFVDTAMEGVCDFLVDPQYSSSTPLQKKTSRLKEMNVSSPILPHDYSDSSEPPTKKLKTVAFTDELHTMIPRLPSQDGMTDPELGAQDASAIIASVLEPLARPGLDEAANEELCQADTIARVPIPPLSPLQATTPREMSSQPQDLFAELREELISRKGRWSGASKLEKSLPWAAFSSRLAKIRPEGDFDDGSCVRYLTGLKLDEEVDTQKLVWKPEGLRVLDADEDDGEELRVADGFADAGEGAEEEDSMPVIQQASRNRLLQPVKPSAAQPSRSTYMIEGGSTTMDHESTQQLLKGRVSERSSWIAITPADVCMPETAFPNLLKSMPRWKKSNEGVDAGSSAVKAQSIQEVLKQRKAKLDKSIGRLGGGNTLQRTESAAKVSISQSHPDAMEHFPQFLTLQGRPITPVAQESTSERARQVPASSEVSLAARKDSAKTPQRSTAVIPMPVIEDRERPLQVIMSASITSNYFMMRKLQELLPALDMITRDYDNQAREADITVSTSTGLMLTNLQKLKQKPLPGQTGFHGIREQVEVAALRYERLIVLVSEGKQSSGEYLLEVSGLDERNANAICDFEGQCASWDAEVEVHYVPGGDEQVIQWLAAVIARYGASDEKCTLLQDETLWEHFLRTAGLNAYAAQVILAELKMPPEAADEGADEAQPESDSLFGLPAFICMTVEERVQRFGALLGGEGVLRRASRSIDGRWPSVALIR